eukprot:CAMPEP_0172657488 /NCGR_PEP_ID=MMETSP1074-20121228/2115_1 /TAXON_ID=2916 /ORGANISM="Ceratium fusus, Strain PA161109" /LENGTH=65 /DNA_ID=CAMNT_0013472571 /DNA_START=614 /DNA_END=807 /DNA_ORIENTATION=-
MSSTYSVASLAQAPLTVLHPVPTHHGVLGLMEEMQRGLCLWATRLNRCATQKMAYNAHKTPEWPR